MPFQIVKFFEYSPKKQSCLEECVDRLENGSKRTKLKSLCRTRWVERHDAFEVFLDLLRPIAEALEEFALQPNTRTPGAADASSLCNCVADFQFIITLVVVHRCLAHIQGLSKSLQSRSHDVGRALHQVDVVRACLQESRQNVDDFHQRCHDAAVEAAESINAPVQMPRLCQRQTKRNNVPAQTPLTYYKRSVTILFLDHVIAEMATIFTQLQERASMGLQLVPSH